MCPARPRAKPLCSTMLRGYLRKLSPDERASFASNIRIMWTADRPFVERLLRDIGAACVLDFVAGALDADPEAQALVAAMRQERERFLNSLFKYRRYLTGDAVLPVEEINRRASSRLRRANAAPASRTMPLGVP